MPVLINFERVAVLGLALFATYGAASFELIAAEPATVISGLKPGEYANPFLVRDCTGPAAGKTLCYYCRYADRPVVALFVRDFNDEVTQFVKRIDAAVGARRQQRLAAFVVLLDKDTQSNEQRLKAAAKRSGLRHTPLTIYRDQAEKLQQTYRLSPRVPVTALAWVRGRVTVNRAFATTQLQPSHAAEFFTHLDRVLDGRGPE